MQSSRF
jgi:hypothetical protein